MAIPTDELIGALLATATRLERGARYSWGHFGACNCGHLAQTLTGLSPAELHEAALERGGDWRERAREYCPATGLRIDLAIERMLAAGLTTSELADLEHLSDPKVLAALPAPRHLARNCRDDVVAYLRAWAALLARRRAERPARAAEPDQGLGPGAGEPRAA